ncbi:hypothetical protein PTKIN_Ptkin06aG0081200 [Pterospermum kingtungense]
MFCCCCLNIQDMNTPSSLTRTIKEIAVVVGLKYFSRSRCKTCTLALCFKCFSLPQLTTRLKYDEHPLTLMVMVMIHVNIIVTFAKRKENHLYGFIPVQNVALLPIQYPYIKRGIKFGHKDHPHRLVIVQNDYYYPLCEKCDEHCVDLAVECEEPKCTYIGHFQCLRIEDSDSFPVEE